MVLFHQKCLQQAQQFLIIHYPTAFSQPTNYIPNYRVLQVVEPKLRLAAQQQLQYPDNLDHPLRALAPIPVRHCELPHARLVEVLDQLLTGT